MPRDVIARRVGEIFERVGLNDHESKLPTKLSGGQQQRVVLARALVFEPSVLLLDEPFSAIDRHLRGRMQDEVKRLHQEFGTTFIFVTHDQSEALSLSSRIAIFNHGRLLQIAAPQEVYERPSSRFVAEFLGRSTFCRSRTSVIVPSARAACSKAAASSARVRITPE